MTRPTHPETFALGFQWPTVDPFLFCVHHDDAYPAGNERMGPVGSLAGRRLGMDFEPRDGFRMYHGHVVPGFPQHPHRGFETVTLARRGYIDHSDSLGAAARFGRGDAQWMTAGAGVVHSEMFPLLDRSESNPVELFQIWLNLPAASKLVPPYFTMLWSERLPRIDGAAHDAPGVEVEVVAGSLFGATPPSPPPDSYASSESADVAIVTFRFAPGARISLPAARSPEALRTFYFFAGESMRIGDTTLPSRTGALMDGSAVSLVNGDSPAEVLLLQGRPIREPVVQHGPFVMNTNAEIQQAFVDYRRTGFGGWPWPSDDPVHARDAGRFARHADGRIEKPTPLDKA